MSNSSFYSQSGGNQQTSNSINSKVNEAEAAKVAAEAAQAAAEAARDTANTAKVDAVAAEAGSQTAQGLSEAARDTATTKASEALISADAASNHQQDASKLAITAEDVGYVLSDNSTGFSALHHAAKASASAAAAALDASSVAADVNTATTQAGLATTKAGEASASAAAALQSEQNASQSETNSSQSEANSSQSETNAGQSEANASASAATATTQAGISTTQAGISTTQAGTSTTKAGEAANSASSALSAQSAAEAARDAALSALDNFQDQYLGTFSSAPTTDLDGDALVAGALYFDTTSDAMKVYDGTQWLNAYASLSGALIAANNLNDLNNAATARSNLGVSTVGNTGAFSDLTGTPTTISGYGITDAFDGAFSSLTGKPTTVAGYGITDAFDGAFSSLTGKPTTVAGYGITDAFDGAYSSLTGTPSLATVATSGAYADLSGTPSLATVATSGAYADLSGTPTIPTNNNQLTNGAGYITSVPAQSFASLTGKPTTLAGYGITDAFDGAYSSLTGTPTIPTNNNQLTNGAGYVTSDTTYTADGDYGMALSGTAFRLEDDRRRNSNTADVYSGNTHDYTFYDADVGIRWHTAGAEDMRLTDGGDLHVDGNVVAYSTTVSDKRLKKDVEPIEDALDKVQKLVGCTFTYTNSGRKSAGLIAQDLELVLPSAVSEDTLPFHGKEGETYKTVQYDQVIGLLVAAVQELASEVKSLKG
jgi:hypothetical protein